MMFSAFCGLQIQVEFKTLIRTLVVKTNPFPPFSRLNRLPYALAMRRVVHLAESILGIRSIYLRHGLTRTDWEPGLSDIDFTVVLSCDLTRQQEYDCVHEFMTSYRALKRWFPMLGEVEILSEECCSAWSRFSIRGLEVGEWRLLHGMDTAKPAFVPNEASMIKNSLDHACWIYETHILGRFYTADPGAWIEKKAMLRLARKLLRYARVESVAGAQKPVTLPDSASAMVLQLLSILDEQVRKALEQSTPVEAAFCGLPHLLDEPAMPGYTAEKFAWLQKFDSSVLSVILSFSTCFIILKDEITLGALNNDLEAMRAICRANGLRPLIMTHGIFRHYLQSYRPQVWIELREYRHVLFGADLLREIDGPTAQSLAGELLNQSLNVMLAPARHVFAHSIPGREREWAGYARRAAFLRLYLDTGFIGSHEHSVRKCQELYPELYGEIGRLDESQDATEKHARDVHAFLRRCALDINGKIESLTY